MDELYKGHGWEVAWEKAPLPDGRMKEGVRIHRADSVHVLAFPTPDTILLLREFRAFYNAYIHMLPSGKADKEQDLPGAADRELREETGFRAEKIDYLWTVNLSDSLAFSHHIFHASDLHHDPLPQDDDELIEVLEVPVAKALELVESSAKIHLVSAYALQRWLRENQ